jgi:phytoene dehydrogenase-like protein
VQLESGEEIAARAIVVATDCPEAVRFLGESVAPLPGAHGSTCVIYYGADKDPNLTGERTIVLNGDGPEAGPINHLAVVSNVQPTYAPPGKALISANTIGHVDDDPVALEKAARAQLRSWYGDVVSSWRHLRTYRIPYALPPQDSPSMREPERSVRVRKGVYVCGDHRDQKTQQGAMMSGRRAAEAVAADLG